MYKHYFICLCEIYMDSSTPDGLLQIDGYTLLRIDHPSNIKRGGVCIYYKESLPFRVMSLPYLKEVLLLEMNYSNTKVIVFLNYRCPSQNNSEFDLFLSNVEKL